MAHDPELDIQYYLDSQSTAFTKGTNLFRGVVRAPSTNGAVPVEAVFVRSYGGPPADRVLGVATEIRHPKVNVIVRSSGYDSGRALAQLVYTKLQSASPSTTNSYMDVRAMQSEPEYMEQDKNLHHFWTLNFAVDYQTT